MSTNGVSSAELTKAYRRIGELEKLLKERQKGERPTKVAEVAEGEAVKDASEAVVQIDGGSDIEGQLKKQLTDEQFSQVTNAFAELKARLAQRAKTRYDYLSAIDPSRLNEKERTQHERYLKLFATRESIRDKMKNGIPNVGAIEEMVKLGMEMTPLAKQERALLTRQVAQELGYQGEDVEVFQDTMQQIYDCTNTGGLGGLEDLGSIGVGIDTSVDVQTQVIAD